MINLKVLQAGCDSKFAIKSLQQYARDRKEAYEAFVAGLENALQQDTLDEALAGFSEYCPTNLDSTVYLGHGVQNSIRETITQVYNGIERYADVTNLDANLNFDITNPSGLKSISLSDLAASIKDQLYSVAALESACEAQLLDTFSDKLNSFKERISSIFSADYVGSQQTLSYYTNIFRNKLDDVAFLQSISAYIGVTEQEAAEDDDAVADIIDKSDVSKYTGASPAGPLNFDSIGNAVASTLKIGAQVVGGIFKSVGSFIGGLFKKGAEKIYQVAVDPDDMYVVNENAEPTFDRLFHQKSFKSTDHFALQFPEWKGYTKDRVTVIAQQLRKHSFKWIKLDQIFGTVLIKFGNVDERPSSVETVYGTEWKISISGLTYQFKFKTLKRGMVNDIINNQSEVVNETKTDMIVGYLQNLKNHDIYASVKDSERDRLIGLEECARLTHCLANASYYEFMGRKVEGSMALENFNAQWQVIQEDATVTNADFFYYATGLGSNSSYTGPSSGTLHDIIQWASIVMIYGFALALLDKSENPLNFSWFPYVNGYEDFLPGKWSIKTDAQNQAAFNTFFTTAIAITVAVVAAVVVSITISRIVRRVFFRRQQFISQMDNKMWSGGTLTQAEMRRYVRYSRKNDAMNLLTAGLSTEKASTITTAAEAAGSLSNSNMVSVYDKIKELIV